MTIDIFCGKFSGEEIGDIERSVSDALDSEAMQLVPIVDDIHSGIFTVSITWRADDTQLDIFSYGAMKSNYYYL